jgi:hypothetical protein
LRRLAVAVLLAFSGSLVAATAASAQSVSNAANDLCDNNVTFEPEAQDSGFLTNSDLQALDNVALDAQGSDGYFKVVVLGSAPGNSSFANDLHSRLGPKGRVVVFDPTQATVVSDVDSTTEQRAAESAAEQTFNTTQRLSEAAQAAVRQLGVTGDGTAVIPQFCTSGGGSGGSGSSGGSSSSGGGNGLIWLIILVVLGAGVLMLFVAFNSRKKKRTGSGAEVPMGAGEQKVRDAVNHASNLVIDLNDRVDAPDAPPEAKQHYDHAASQFAQLGDELEAADTRAELEAVYPKLVDIGWELDTAKALLDGTPPPPKPEPEVLFPPLMAPSTPSGPAGPAGLPPPAPGPPPEPSAGGYRSHEVSPWLTTAAMTAMSVLMSRGMSGPSRTMRPPSDDGWFSGTFGGGSFGGSRGSRGMGGRSSGGFHMGGGKSGRGMGRRR